MSQQQNQIQQQDKPKYCWRYDLINHLIKKNNYQTYLEIGVEGGDCFRSVSCQVKHGVDPASVNATHKVTSDEFFGSLPADTKYDIVFVDGLHVHEQAYSDVINALNHLSDNGTILMHDCNPPSEWHQRSYLEAQKNGCRLWNGTVWKAFVQLRQERDDLEMYVVDTDWGCGVIRKGDQKVLQIPDEEIKYSDLAKNRKEWLNLISVEQFYQLF